VWLDLADDFYWSHLCQGISFGKPGSDDSTANSPYAYGFEFDESLFTIFDTGTSFTMIPKDYWIAFTDNLIVVAEIQKY
jgi:hypothetical protein